MGSLLNLLQQNPRVYNTIEKIVRNNPNVPKILGFRTIIRSEADGEHCDLDVILLVPGQVLYSTTINTDWSEGCFDFSDEAYIRLKCGNCGYDFWFPLEVHKGDSDEYEEQYVLEGEGICPICGNPISVGEFDVWVYHTITINPPAINGAKFS